MKNHKNNLKNKKRVQDSRESLDLKSQFKKVQTGIKNGVFIFSSPLSVQEFADKLEKGPSEILKYFFLKGKILNLNTMLSEEEIGELCLEYNYDFEKRLEVDESNILSVLKVDDDPKNLKKRPPIVTIMGHVDHGKTTLLDYIRKSHVVRGEAGGITQHIGAYQATYQNEKITFIDTPGHEAFTQMRSRGASVTDIVVLVVAGDDGIKPQTEEAIDHAKAAHVPIIVFMNKMDKPDVKPDVVLSQLSDHGLTPEEWGGETIVVRGSALKGQNVDKLLETILLIAELKEYKANPNRLGMGLVLESNVDTGLGPIATVIVTNGTLTQGDYIIFGKAFGKIRIMFDENGNEVKLASPSQPVKIVGINECPSAGDHFVVQTNDKDIKELAKKIKIHETKAQYSTFNDGALTTNENDSLKHLNVLIKTDVNGTLEAIRGVFSKIDVPGTKLNIIRGAVGAIVESDISLAKASKAIIIGFNVKPSRIMKEVADNDHVQILFFDIIYKLKEEIERLLNGSLDPVYKEEETAEANVLQIWTHSEIGTIIGCMITSGEINRNNKVRVLREGKVICDTEIASIKRYKEVVNKASAGMECGIVLVKYNDVKPNDVIQAYKIVKQ